MFFLCIIGAFLPFAALVSYVFRYGVNIPFWDQWELIPLLEKTYTDTLSFADLYLQHNEHRLVFPKLVMLGLARISGWNIRVEMAASVIIAIGIFLVIWSAVTRYLHVMGMKPPLWLLPVLSLIIFSLSQWQNWLEGWQLQIFLCLFFVLGGFFLLCSEKVSQSVLFLSLGSGTIAAYSFATGLSFFPVGLILLFLRYRHSLRHHLIDLAIWLSGMVIVFGSYFYHYHHPTASPPLAVSITQLPEALLYFFAYLGTPVSGFSLIAAIYGGMIGIGLCSYLFFIFFVDKKSTSVKPWFFLALGLFALFSAATTAISRSGFSPIQALSSRYISMTNFFWIAIIFLLSRQSQPYRKELSRVGMIIIVTAIGITSMLSTPDFSRHATYLQEAADSLLTGTHPERLERLYPETAIMKERIEILKKYHLSLYNR